MDYTAFFNAESSLFESYTIDTISTDNNTDTICLIHSNIDAWHRGVLLTDDTQVYYPVIVVRPHKQPRPTRIQIQSTFTKINDPYSTKRFEQYLKAWNELATATIIYSVPHGSEPDWYYLSPTYGYGIIREQLQGSIFRFIDRVQQHNTELRHYTPILDTTLYTKFNQDTLDTDTRLCTLTGTFPENKQITKHKFDVYASSFIETVIFTDDTTVTRTFPLYDITHAINTYHNDMYTCTHLTNTFKEELALHGL